MKKTASMRTACVATLLIAAGGVLAQNHTPPTADSTKGEVPTAMYEFLGGWLIENDRVKAMSYFSASERAFRLAPDRVWMRAGAIEEKKLADYRSGYWELMNSVWRPRRGEKDGLGDVLAPVTDELASAFESGFDVRVVSKAMEDPFLVFVASNDMSIYSFDGAHRDAATVLMPRERATLGMLAGFADGSTEDDVSARNAGPFVSFWQEEPEGWRIQMVGAVLP